MKSEAKIPKSLDKAMDKSLPSGKHVQPGISIRNGPIDEMDIDKPATKELKKNGLVAGKRKGRQSMGNGQTCKEMSSDEDDSKPLVRSLWTENLLTARIAKLS